MSAELAQVVKVELSTAAQNRHIDMEGLLKGWVF